MERGLHYMSDIALPKVIRAQNLSTCTIRKVDVCNLKSTYSKTSSSK